MEAIHKNDLSAYLSDWKMKIEMINRLSKIGKNKPQPIPKTFQAIFNQTIDLSVMLRYLDSFLRILENNKSPLSIDYQAYADAIVFLKASYLFFHILLDTLVGVIGDFYKEKEEIALPDSFNKLLRRDKEGKLPKDLSGVLKNTHIWVPEFIDRRVDLVHHYESFLIFLKKNKNGEYILEHSNRSFGNEFKNFGEIRKYIGSLLCVYQQLIDDLLDHFDTKLNIWYGTMVDRSITIREGDMLWWWAGKYGNYTHPDFVIKE